MLVVIYFKYHFAEYTSQKLVDLQNVVCVCVCVCVCACACVRARVVCVRVVQLCTHENTRQDKRQHSHI